MKFPKQFFIILFVCCLVATNLAFGAESKIVCSCECGIAGEPWGICSDNTCGPSPSSCECRHWILHSGGGGHWEYNNSGTCTKKKTPRASEPLIEGAPNTAIDNKAINTTIRTLQQLGVDPNTVLEFSSSNGPENDPDLNSCGYMGETKITECSDVPESNGCPLGQCKIGGGGGKIHCAYWPPCSSTSCPVGSTCVNNIAGCNSYCSKYAKKQTGTLLKHNN